MKVILKKDVKGTGKAGDVVRVSDGFARNKLIPSGEAVEATKQNIRAIEKEKALKAEQEAQEKAEAQEIAAELEAKTIVIKVKTGEGGKLFGSITNKDVSEAIKEQTGRDVDKKKIELANPIKQVGSFTVQIKLHSAVTAEVNLVVTEK